ncbi:NSFL1 cofactor p47-like isoform 1-T1 [Salvelinus alpinus]|uniref:NSFL1 cofactor p47 n=1 Tax=Salmo salar TaxID=8030 RepID=A0A1S3MEF0_SALSA|nr:NSFL1 cofactor p47-like isoform X1 [Salmo salar]XP_029575444.1 NSFL1 cofactor p47-like isoform X1 [Salmo trutta]|eukprot:XP_014001445.1 PREDICTED: NSFL1 cofactor p47-like isoform X1 [Salmo salar]
MADQESSVREFVAVTDVDEERARFFLESAGWDLQLALASFFEDGAEDDIVTLPQPESGGSSVPRSTGPGRSENRVTSFRDMMHEEEDDSDEEEGERFFAGGSERSGQQIVGPPKKKSSNEVVEDLFKGAKEHGAVPVEKAGRGPGEPSRARPFIGGGYRLGAAPEEEPVYVAGERRAANSQQDKVHVVLKLWKTGFSLGDGELRNYSDPGNAIFLESIRRGEIPLELRQRSRGGQVNLDMEDHRDEDFSKPKVTFKAFGGEGQKLGSATPELVSAPRMGDQDQVASEAQAIASVNLDASQPVTNIQIRLADGGRLVQKFNHTHRVSDVRQFVVGARPLMAATEFVLITTFPNKELTDESQTLRDANLLNAVIVQRLK